MQSLSPQLSNESSARQQAITKLHTWKAENHRLYRNAIHIHKRALESIQFLQYINVKNNDIFYQINTLLYYWIYIIEFILLNFHNNIVAVELKTKTSLWKFRIKNAQKLYTFTLMINWWNKYSSYID